MATTKLWHIQGRLKDLVDYVENPEKTVKPGLQDFLNVFSYTQNPNKTAGGQFVTAINCQKDIALQQMILTKQRYGKEDGYIAWHGYQSFKPGEVTPEQCHALGVELARQMWGDRFQIIVTTHLDKEHLHNHFCINSVSFKDGGKYNFSKKELKRLRDTSDRLCREQGLSVVEHPHKAPSRQVWLNEQADPLEIYTEKDGGVIFRKYSPMGDLQEFAAQMCESIGSATGHIAAVTDRDSIIALYGIPKRELMDKPNSPELEKLMEQRKNYLYKNGDAPILAADGEEKYHLGAAAPILSQGDLMGCVLLLLGENDSPLQEADQGLVKTAAGFLGKQMEN